MHLEEQTETLQFMLVPGIHVTALIQNVADVPHNHKIHFILWTYICICYKKQYKYIKLLLDI